MIERQAGETQLFVKEARIGEKRYIICRNEAEAEKDRKAREAIVAALHAQFFAKTNLRSIAYENQVSKLGMTGMRECPTRNGKAKRCGCHGNGEFGVRKCSFVPDPIKGDNAPSPLMRWCELAIR